MRARIVLVLVLVVVLASCGPQRRGELVGAPVIPETIEEQRGERLFYRYCSTCHPHGEAGLGPALNDKPLPEVAIEQQIRRGLGEMPAFPEEVLSDAEVDEIAEYVTLLRDTPTAPEPTPRADPRPPDTSASR